MNLTTTDSQATGFPLVIATQTQQPTARLQLRNSHGQIIQQWLIKSNKCTLGSAVSCGLRCELPGVAPYHALLVIGARQIFVRALAPKLTRDGQPFNELLLTNDDSHFEIAGYRFELNRNQFELEPAARAEASSPQRIKFALARPFELQNRPQAKPIPPVSTVQQAADRMSESRPSHDSKWVAQLIQAAMQPIECQLHNLAGPLSELQRESRNQRRLRKRRALRKRHAADTQPDVAGTNAAQESSSPAAEQVQLAEQVEAIVVKHSAAMEELNQRVSDVSGQLLTIERIIAEQRQAHSDDSNSPVATDSPQVALQSAAIEQLQQGVASVSSTLIRLQAEQSAVREDDQQWRIDLQSQLCGLTQIIDGLSANVADVHLVALRATPLPDANTQSDPDLSSASHLYPVEHSRADEEPSSALYSQPEAYSQPERHSQPALDALSSPDSPNISLPVTLDDWGLAADEQTAPPQAGSVETECDGPVRSEIDQYDFQYATPEDAEQVAAAASEELLNSPSQPTNFHYGDGEFAYHDIQPDLAQDEFWMLGSPQQHEHYGQYEQHEQSHVDLPAQPVVESKASYDSDSPHLPAIDAIGSEQPMWTVLEPTAEVANPAAEAEAIQARAATLPPELNQPELTQPELIQPAAESGQSMWLTLQADAATVANTPSTREIEPGEDAAQSASNSLPSWWADDDSIGVEHHDSLPTADAPEHSAAVDDVRMDGLAGESLSVIDERIYDNTSEYDERIDESMLDIEGSRSDSVGAKLSDQPSEEFFGLAQLDLDEHLREADSLRHAPLPIEHTGNASAGEIADEQVRQDEHVDAAQSEAMLELPRGDDNAVELDESDSVEEYMRKLLARMRGVPEEEVELPVRAEEKPAAPSARAMSHAATSNLHGVENTPPSRAAISDQPTSRYASDSTRVDGYDVTEPFDPDKYLPRALAPERSNSLAAMRELANSSARTAIHKSTRQRHVSSIALKSVIACVGLVVGMVLLAINGLNLNIGLVATVAAFLVAAIWGYDTISSIRPMLQHGLVLKPQSSSVQTPTEEQDGAA